jgi:hypothetical protein
MTKVVATKGVATTRVVEMLFSPVDLTKKLLERILFFFKKDPNITITKP